MSNSRYLIFEVQGEKHGLLLEHVAEIMDPPCWYPIPKAPHYYRGVMNCHGRPMPVLDLGLLYRGCPAPPGGKILVLRGNSANLAFVVDQVLNIAAGHSVTGGDDGGGYGIAVTVSCEGAMVKIIDPGKLLDILEAEVNQPVVRAPQNSPDRL